MLIKRGEKNVVPKVWEELGRPLLGVSYSIEKELKKLGETTNSN